MRREDREHLGRPTKGSESRRRSGATDSSRRPRISRPARRPGGLARATAGTSARDTRRRPGRRHRWMWARSPGTASPPGMPVSDPVRFVEVDVDPAGARVQRGQLGRASARRRAPPVRPPPTRASCAPGVPTWAAVALGTRKMPLPIMLPTTMAMADMSPSRRSNVGLLCVIGDGCNEGNHDRGGTADRVGFEPTIPVAGIPVFETGSFSHSDTCPDEREVRVRSVLPHGELFQRCDCSFEVAREYR